MANNYEKRRVPEYLDVDEFFRDAQRTVLVGRDVMEALRRENGGPLTTQDTIYGDSIEGLF